MITKILTNSNPYPTVLGINQLLQVSSSDVFRFQETNDICYCAIECTYTELAFAEIGGEDYKNDKASFLFRKVDDNDIITFELWKDGIKIEDLINNTFGQYFATFTASPLQTGFILNWEDVLSVHGTGLYQFRANATILGDLSVFESQLYRLYPYSDENADKTVRISAFHTGNIKGSRFDFSDLVDGGWPFYARVSGNFQEITPETVLDNYLDSEDNKLQRQDKLISQYELFVKQVPYSIVSLFLKGNISLGNTILITDYDIFNVTIYRGLSLYYKDQSYEPLVGQRRQDITVQFSSKREDLYTQNF